MRTGHWVEFIYICENALFFVHILHLLRGTDQVVMRAMCWQIITLCLMGVCLSVVLDHSITELVMFYCYCYFHSSDSETE